MSNKSYDPRKMGVINSVVKKIDVRENKKIPNPQRNLKELRRRNTNNKKWNKLL